MIDAHPEMLQNLVIGDKAYAVTFVKTALISDQMQASLYTIAGDRFHELTIYAIGHGTRTPAKSPVTGRPLSVGFVRGKGTLVVEFESGSENTYYFENEGRNQVIHIEAGQSFHWTATDDSDLAYFELSDALLHQPEQPSVPAQPSPPRQPKSQQRVRLFLVSQLVSQAQSEALSRLVGKPARVTSLALIENGADMDSGEPDWVLQNRQMLERLGYSIERIDLRTYGHHPIELLQKLQNKDIVWLGGGNTFYLRWILYATRADEMIVHLVQKGKLVYAGGSAGAIVAGPTLKYFDLADNPKGVPAVIQEGLHLTNKVIVPHVDDTSFTDVADTINQRLLQDAFATIPLKNTQVYVVDGTEETLL